jgi:hypothetical protein
MYLHLARDGTENGVDSTLGLGMGSGRDRLISCVNRETISFKFQTTTYRIIDTGGGGS